MKTVIATLCLLGLVAAMMAPTAAAVGRPTNILTPSYPGIKLSDLGSIIDADVGVSPTGSKTVDFELEFLGQEVEFDSNPAGYSIFSLEIDTIGYELELEITRSGTDVDVELDG